MQPGRPAGSHDSIRFSQTPEEVFARLQDRLLGLLFYQAGDRAAAEAAFQEVFGKCWRRLESSADVQDLETWIFGTALHVGRQLRSSTWRLRRSALQEKGLQAVEQASTAHPSSPDQLALAQRAVLELQPEDLEVFLLRQNGGMAYEEIARVIDVSVETAKSRMRRALSKLRESLQPKG